jgi:cytochrome b6-f complex iron-sulfur subunit
MPEITRRDFLKLATIGALTASGLAGAAALLRFLGVSTEPAPKTEFDLGVASNFPVGSQSVIADIPAVIVHSESGFAAISLVCTHLGCTVEPKADGFACPCHGSLFAKDGSVVRGPAQKALSSLRIEINKDGHLILHADS